MANKTPNPDAMLTAGMGLLSDANAYYACPDCLHTFMAPFRFDHQPVSGSL